MTLLLDEGTELGNGRYVLQERLGAGGAATVWLAEDTVLGRPVAVKVLSEALAADESWLNRFRREARMAARLTHPNLVSVYDYGTDGERPYIVMEHMPGGSLHDVIETQDSLDPHLLARDLLSALAAVHSAGIIHRDIKPGNVMFAEDGTACLTDFGVARPQDATSLTHTGQIPGTASFMAPELWKGHPADQRTDLYAVGIVLRRASDGEPPRDLAPLVDSLAAEDPAQRPESARAALDELGAEPEPEPDTPVLPAEPTQRTQVMADEPRRADEPRTADEPQTADEPKKRSSRLPVLAGAAVLLVIAAVALSQLLGGGEDTPAGGGDSAPTANEESQGGNDNANRDSGGGNAAANPEPEPTEPSEPVSTDPNIDPVALDQEGKALIDAGDPESAIPLLQQAVDYYPEDSQDINYAYSLYNLGDALVQSGRPEEAIPYLEKRLEFSDQRETVQALLDEARAAAGG